MMTMEQMNLLISDLSSGFFIRQIQAILLLFAIGVTFLYVIREHMKALWIYLLAFPVGMALWCVTGFTILSLGIPFHLVSELVVIAAVTVAVWLLKRRRHRYTEVTDHVDLPFAKTMIAATVLMIAAFVATSGRISISISNDTMYYYMYYPEVLAKEGAYLRGFDVFLSDVGPMAALIGTLPSFFDFDEIYGIQQVFQMNFLMIFIAFVYERAKEKLSFKTSIVVTVLSSVLLMSATPYIVIAKWILANVYVMCYSFILFALAYKADHERTEEPGGQSDMLILLMLLSALISMLRMEGSMLMCFIILCISTLRYSNREMITRFLLPAGIMPLLYYIRYFVFLKVNPLYAFLTWQKAAIAITLMVLLGHYLGAVRGKHFLRLQRQTGWLILAGLTAVNLGLFVIAPSEYRVVLRAFWQNLIFQEGWGYTVYLVLAGYLVLFFAGRIRHQTLGYENLVFIGYIFYTVAVGFARGGGLRRGVADSGNRVMLQVIPFMIFAFTFTAIELLERSEYQIRKKQIEQPDGAQEEQLPE